MWKKNCWKFSNFLSSRISETYQKRILFLRNKKCHWSIFFCGKFFIIIILPKKKKCAQIIFHLLKKTKQANLLNQLSKKDYSSITKMLSLDMFLWMVFLRVSCVKENIFQKPPKARSKGTWGINITKVSLEWIMGSLFALYQIVKNLFIRVKWDNTYWNMEFKWMGKIVDK